MDNDFPKMVYRAPGPHDIHGHRLDFGTVNDADDLAAAKEAGWFETTPEAVDAHAAKVSSEQAGRVAQANALAQAAANTGAATRAELELKARELGITFDGRTSDAKLSKAIDEKLAG